MKTEWRQRTLPKSIHLTVSGCLGPCDASNVVLLLFGDNPVWLGGLNQFEHYEAIADWADASRVLDSVQPLPAILEPFRMERFHDLEVPLEV